MTDDDYDALSQKQLASIKRDMRISLEDAAVRATYKVMAELETEQNQGEEHMTQDEIIELARQASFTENSGFKGCFVCNPLSLEAFAKLVAEKEREACAKLCDDINAEYEAKDVFSSYAEAIRERGQA